MTTALTAAIQAANSAVHEKGSQNIDFNRMGTTCVTLALGPQGAVIGHVGDSRLYRVRREQIDQLTFDHSLEWELIRHGRLKPNDHLLPEVKHVITRSIGPEPVAEPEVDGPFPARPGDAFLLCSDGLTGLVKDAEIGAITKHLPPNEACRLLINLANLRGGTDNITVVIAQVGPLPEGVAPTPEEETDEADAGEADQFGWLWLGGLWASAITFTLGTCWALIQEEEKSRGIALAGLSLVAAMVIGIMWRTQRRKQRPVEPKKAESTVLSKAYRSASAKLTPEFLTMLGALEDDMIQSAATEEWGFDKPAHESAHAAAAAAIEQKRLPIALKELGRSIDLLMVGLLQHRKAAAAAREAESKEAKAGQ
jgi:protein phosphatase